MGGSRGEGVGVGGRRAGGSERKGKIILTSARCSQHVLPLSNMLWRKFLRRKTH